MTHMSVSGGLVHKDFDKGVNIDVSGETLAGKFESSMTFVIFPQKIVSNLAFSRVISHTFHRRRDCLLGKKGPWICRCRPVVESGCSTS